MVFLCSGFWLLGFLRILTTLMIAAVAMVVEAVAMYGSSIGDD